MKRTIKNKLTGISGGLLLAALITYLISPGSLLIDLMLIIAAIVSGVPILKKAIQALRMRAFSIELLVSIAVIGAMIIGEYTEAAVVTFLFLFGDYLEGRTLRKTRASLRSLMDMAPQEAIVVREGTRMTIPVDQVEVGDRIIVPQGARIPVDGTVLSGSAQVNESAITGESIPKTKKSGDSVYSSSISEGGYLEITAEAVGEDTTFSKIIEMVEEAQESKAKTQKFMERFAAYYTPGIIVLSLLLGLLTKDAYLALTFLVIACPGALVISVPVSIVAGIGNGAKNGILIKGGDKMESLAKVQAMVFDKTGTLTKGKPEVTQVKAFEMSQRDLLELAAEVELRSEHHLGAAIVKKASDAGWEPRNIATQTDTMKGHGLRAVVDGRDIYIGNLSGARKLGKEVDPETKKYLSAQQEKGYTAVVVITDQRVAGVISIADQVREEAPQALQALREEGIGHMVMLTGDNQKVAQQTARDLELDQVFAELLPQDKVEKVQQCKDSGVKLAMLGDGVNDAPAIATADVGIAMGGTATEVTMETADVVLLSGKLDKLPYAVSLAKATVRNMKQNTYFSLATVALLLLGVLTGNIHLASGMLIHEISVLAVILNAVRLVQYPKLAFRIKRPSIKGPRFKKRELELADNICHA